MHINFYNFIKFIKKTDSVFEYIGRFYVFISGTLLVLVTLIIFAGVINRSFLGFIWVFVEEWSSLALLPMSYLAMGYTLRCNRHLRIDILVERLSNRWQNIFMIFAAAFSIVCLVFMIEASAQWFLYTYINKTQSFGPMRTPLWIFSASIVIGLVFFLIDMLLLLINRILALMSGILPVKLLDD
jgi:C4-dicarboxylate transporter, DctQ subunit